MSQMVDHVTHRLEILSAGTHGLVLEYLKTDPLGIV